MKTTIYTTTILMTLLAVMTGCSSPDAEESGGVSSLLARETATPTATPSPTPDATATAEAMRQAEIEALIEKGQAADYADEHEKAIEIFSEVLELDPENVVALVGRGRAYRIHGIRSLTSINDFKAISDLEKASLIEPNYPNSYRELGLIFREQGDWLKAKEYCEISLDISPSYSDGYLCLAYLASDNNQRLEAMNHFSRAIELDSSNLYAYLNRAQARRAYFSDFEGALADNLRALHLNPNIQTVHAQLGISYYQLDDLENAIHHLNIALDLDPTSKLARDYRGYALQALSQIADD